MSRPIVVHLCGPHKSGHGQEWDAANILPHRIDAAIAEARRLRAPLIIAGDGWRGSDVRFFEQYARGKVVVAIGALDIRGGTLHDVQATLRVLEDGLWSGIDEVRFVTDPEHIRPLVFARGEAEKLFPRRHMEFIHVHAHGGPAWSELELKGERLGIEHYRAGTYGRPLQGLEALGKLPLESRLQESP